MDEDEVIQMHITVDLTDCKNVHDFWNRIKVDFGFQNHFGKNWDAFWDMLSWEFPGNQVTIIGANTLPKNWKALDGETYPEKMRRILRRTREERIRFGEEFAYEFIDA